MPRVAGLIFERRMMQTVPDEKTSMPTIHSKSMIENGHLRSPYQCYLGSVFHLSLN